MLGCAIALGEDLICCKEWNFDIQSRVMSPDLCMIELPDKTLHALLEKEAVDFFLQIFPIAWPKLIEERVDISNMVLDFFRPEVIQAV